MSATVSWESRGQGSQYLVTWELMSGGLRGHLVSADTSAALPLWPDEDYVVQVSVLLRTYVVVARTSPGVFTVPRARGDFSAMKRLQSLFEDRVVALLLRHSLFSV